MANRYFTEVGFTLEKNVVSLYGLVNIGSGGAMNLVVGSSKGIANVWQNTPTFTAVTSSGSSTLNSISSYAGLFTGMTLTTSSGSVITNSVTVGTITATSIVMSAAANGFTGSTGGTFYAQGGQYIFQFGANTTVGSLTSNTRLDTYNKLLMYETQFDMATASSIGTATQVQLAPQNIVNFITANHVAQRSVGSGSYSATSASTDASITLQFGIGGGTSFVAQVPQPGEVMRVQFTLGNSSAP